MHDKDGNPQKIFHFHLSPQQRLKKNAIKPGGHHTQTCVGAF